MSQTIPIDGGEWVARVTEHKGGRATLWWWDGVANEWTETYDDLATALARVAVLLALPESGLFRNPPELFERRAREFFRQEGVEA